VLRGRLHRGAGGAAGEIGYLPVPGVPLPQDVGHPATGAFQSLVGGQAVLPLASRYGFAAATPGAAVAAAVAAGAAGDQRGTDFIADLASRVATGVAAISVVLDPALVVLGGEVGRAGGMALASRVAAGVTRICPARPRVVPTAVAGPPVLCGAILTAVDQARADLLDSVATPQPTPVEAPAS
jgi:predicted NBD/HSP70 family sugar kinase